MPANLEKKAIASGPNFKGTHGLNSDWNKI